MKASLTVSCRCLVRTACLRLSRRHADDGAVLPFPPVPSASKAAPRLQDSVHKRRAQPRSFEAGRAEHTDRPARRRRLRPGLDLRRRDQHADHEQAGQPGHQLQHLSHDGDLLADARGAADRPQPPARRQRHDRRTRRGLGRLHRRDPEDLGDDGRGAARTTATRPPPLASGTTRRPTRPRRWVRSIAGPPATASTTSTASWPARLRSGSRGWSRTPRRSSRRTTRTTT